MVSWICPECACECAPTDHECPDCTDLVHAGMLALAQTVQTQLGNLPPPPDVQNLVSLRFADPRVPDPLAPWPIEAEPELAPVLGLFVPCIGASLQPDVWAEPEPVRHETPAHTEEMAAETAPVAEETLATEGAIELAVPVETTLESGEAVVPAPQVFAVEPEIELTSASVETTPETTEEVPNVSREIHAAEPAIELAPAHFETIAESVGELAEQTRELLPVEPQDTAAVPPEVPAAGSAIEFLSPPVETIPENTRELAVEPEIELATAPVETDAPETTPETPEEAAIERAPPIVDPTQDDAAFVPPVLAVEPEIELAPTAVETTAEEAATESEQVQTAEPPLELAPAPVETTQEAAEPTPEETLPEVLPIQEMMPGAVRPVQPKPSASAEFRYRDAQPEFPPVTPLVVSSLSGPVDQTTASGAPAPAPPSIATPTQRKIKLPGWMVSLLVATGLSLGGAVIVRNMGFSNKAEPVSAATSQPGESAPAAGSPASFSRFIEVTGLRVVVDLQKGSKVHYILVNHGPTILTNMQLRIDVYSAASSENSKPLFTVAALVSGLEPSSSREMTASIDDLRDAVIPDWENLRPRVQVVTQ